MADPEHLDADPDPNFLTKERDKNIFHIFNNFNDKILTELVMCNFLSNNDLIDKKADILVLSMGRDERRGIRG